ncbi:MAG: hypothetical protein IAB19_04760, partial [Proteobacteria bacterium]|nr:hypothetical protein [Candidatus Avisuccinivibrio stercorigallinarum]
AKADSKAGEADDASEAEIKIKADESAAEEESVPKAKAKAKQEAELEREEDKAARENGDDSDKELVLTEPPKDFVVEEKETIKTKI